MVNVLPLTVTVELVWVAQPARAAIVAAQATSRVRVLMWRPATPADRAGTGAGF